jgi:hypothetical protein
LQARREGRAQAGGTVGSDCSSVSPMPPRAAPTAKAETVLSSSLQQ